MTGTATTSFPIFAAAASERESLIVSVHDIAPATQKTAQKILAELARHGVRVTSLLVVPNYHENGASMEDREFVSWLRNLEADGHEIVIHGYYHRRPAQGGESLPAMLMTQSYTAGEGEFYDLGYDQARERITRARDEFTAAGLKPRGFIAPAWLLSQEAERAAADAGMEYTTRLTNVRDLRTGETFSARSLVYSARNAWRRAVSLAWNAGLARVLCHTPLLRLGLHPPDFEHEQIWHQIASLLNHVGDTRMPTTYCDWIADRRLEAADRKTGAG